MFSCIYFHEDASLGIVCKNDKNLKVLEGFTERCSVEMKWGKTLFHGTIIKTGECKATLDKFAADANKRVLKKISSVPKEVPEELFIQDTTQSELCTGKRQRLQQEKVQGENNAVTQCTKPKKTKTTQETKKTSEKISRKTATKVKTKKDLESAADLVAATNMCLQFGDTPLTETWDLCCGGSSRPATVGVEKMTSSQTSKTLPDPPSELLEAIKVLYKPEVQAYLEAFTRHYRLGDSANAPEIQGLSNTGNKKPTCTITSSHQIPQPDIPNYDINSHIQHHSYDSESEFNDRPHTQILPYPDYTSSHMFDVSFSTPDNYTHMSTPFSSTAQNKIQSTYSLPQQQSYSTLPDLNLSHQLTHTDIAQVNQTPNKQQTYTTLLPVNNKENLDIHVPEEISHRNVSGQQAQPRRTSPRKSLNILDKDQVPPMQISRKASDVITHEDQTKVKLMDYSSIVVDREMLRKATSGAMKAQKPGYALCMKVLPLLFSTDEMARSRGQGLTKKKEGDLRPVLDKEKITLMKDYVATWCAKNGHSRPSDAKLNDGVTEKIAYCRKLLKKQE